VRQTHKRPSRAGFRGGALLKTKCAKRKKTERGQKRKWKAANEGELNPELGVHVQEWAASTRSAFIHLYLSACTLEGARRAAGPRGDSRARARCSALLPPKVVNVTQFAAAWMIHINRRRRRPSARTFSANGSWTSAPRFRLGIFALMSSLLRSLGHDCRIFAHRAKKALGSRRDWAICTRFATWCASDARVQVSKCVSVCDTLRPPHTLIRTHF
jgi:hypothetical protein